MLADQPAARRQFGLDCLALSLVRFGAFRAIARCPISPYDGHRQSEFAALICALRLLPPYRAPAPSVADQTPSHCLRMNLGLFIMRRQLRSFPVGSAES
jgi:hypothetical protein